MAQRITTPRGKTIDGISSRTPGRVKITPIKSLSDSVKKIQQFKSNSLAHSQAHGSGNALNRMGKGSNSSFNASTSDARLMPNRSNSHVMDSDLFSRQPSHDDKENAGNMSLAERQMSKSLLGLSMNDTVLHFNKAAVEESRVNKLTKIYGLGDEMRSKTQQKRMVNRYIPQRSDKTLDAPKLKDDFYMSLIDWSKSNLFMGCLDDETYLYDISANEINLCCTVQNRNGIADLDAEHQFYTCVKFVPSGPQVAVGTSAGHIEIWDTSRKKCVRDMHGDLNSYACCLDWNSYNLTAGTQHGRIVQFDVRQPKPLVSSFQAHNQVVCGLQWSPCQSFLASGSNENLVKVWSSSMMPEGAPRRGDHHFVQEHCVLTIDTHLAAVRALAWNPWKSNLLVTGGGANDRSIQFHNTVSGDLLHKIQTNSSVTGLLWNERHRELASSHGNPDNHLALWSYPQCELICELKGHDERVLCVTQSPDGAEVASASADESIKFWDCWSYEDADQSVNNSSMTSRNKSRNRSALDLDSAI